MRTALLFLTFSAVLHAQEIKPIERTLPPQGAAISKEETQRLTTAVAALEKEASSLRPEHSGDVLALTKAVKFALVNGEFEKPGDTKIADELLALAKTRLAAAKSGKTTWTKTPGLTVRGFVSKIDGSAQPYGVDAPEGYDFSRTKLKPCVIWLHGRGDKETDLYFIKNRLTKKGQFPSEKDVLVIHPFGRHCLGYKSAGETDVLEALAHAQTEYPIDPDKVAIMGFSMGGAGAWHMGAHYADLWSVVHAGAGFVDVRRYTNTNPADVPPWERTLWGVYDVPDYARNFLSIPVVAYSGAEDKQKAAADIMEAELKAHGFTLPHIIGTKMGHKYDADSQKKVWALVKEKLKAGRDPFPNNIHFQTKTVRYGRFRQLLVDGLEEHWKDARVDATFAGEKISLTTSNVSRLILQLPKLQQATLTIDGATLKLPVERGLVRLEKVGQWKKAQENLKAGAQKRPGLQGPMDDALLEPFLVVLPGKKSSNAQVQRWLDFETARFAKFWREVFRGELRTKLDSEVTAQDIASYHLILWGDESCNAVLARLKGKLPVRWERDQVVVGNTKYPAANHLPAFIFPNPEAGYNKYVVVNNGCSFREGHCKTNSRQNPKLPDWAVFDLTQDPNATSAGKVVAAGFFDENWRVK